MSERISQAAWLASLDDAALERLLAARPDVLTRPPRTLADLAAMLGSPIFVSDALRRLDRGAVQVLGLLGALGPSSVKQLEVALAPDAPLGHVAAALDRLAGAGLAWPDGTGQWRAPKAMTGLWRGLHGLGLAELAAGERAVVAVEPELAPVSPATHPEPALGLVEQVRALLVLLDGSTVKTLQSGGVGVQEQRRLAKLLGWDADVVRRLLHLAGDARLLTTGSRAGVVTQEGAEWLTYPEDRAAVALLAAAVEAGRVGPEEYAPLWGMPWQRPTPTLRAVLASLADEPRRPARAWLRWRWFGARGDDVTGMMDALTHLGLVAADRVQPWAAPLLTGDLAAAEALLAAALPAEQDDAILQADGTAVVTGRPSPSLRRLLDLIAVRESDRTWRVDADRVRAALDTGVPAAALLEDLRRHSRHAVPQVVEQVLHDVAGRHGRIRVVPSATLLRIDDHPLAVELLRDKRLKPLGLIAVQPGVLSSSKKPGDVLAALRSAGHAPEGPPEPSRRRPPAAAHRSYPAFAAVPADVVRALREPPPTTGRSSRMGIVPMAYAAGSARFDHLSPADRILLARAFDDGRPVQLEYVDSAGMVTSRIVEDLVDEGDLLFGWCRLRDDERTFAPRGIRAVRPVT